MTSTDCFSTKQVTNSSYDSDQNAEVSTTNDCHNNEYFETLTKNKSQTHLYNGERTNYRGQQIQPRRKQLSFSSDVSEVTDVTFLSDEDSNTVSSTFTASSAYPGPRRRNISQSSSSTSYSEVHRDCEDKIHAFYTYRRILIFLFAINALLIFCIIALLLYVKTKGEVEQPPLETTSTAPLQTTTPIDYEAIFKGLWDCDKNEGGDCYLRQLSHKLQQDIRDAVTAKTEENCMKRVAAHFSNGIPRESRDKMTQYYEVHKWTGTAQSNNIDITDDAFLHIPEDGLYFLYIQMHFKEKSASVTGEVNASHIVQKRHREASYEQIFSDDFTCTFRNGDSYQNPCISSLKRVVNCTKNEEIRVLVNYDSTKLETSRSNNHIGLFKLC